jgi:hypothetical protein
MIKRRCFSIVLIFLLSLAVFSGCTRKDKGAELQVLAMLENAQTISDLSELEKDTERFFKAKEVLDESFVNEEVEKRILAALRLYRPAGWEVLKTVRENEETYVVMYLRSDSKLMGEPVDKRPGWRKALFRMEQKEGKWQIADLDYIIKKYGDKPFYNSDKE